MQGNGAVGGRTIRIRKDFSPHRFVVSAQVPSEQHIDVEGQSVSVSQSDVSWSGGIVSGKVYQQVDNRTIVA